MNVADYRGNEWLGREVRYYYRKLHENTKVQDLEDKRPKAPKHSLHV